MSWRSSAVAGLVLSVACGGTDGAAVGAGHASSVDGDVDGGAAPSPATEADAGGSTDGADANVIDAGASAPDAQGAVVDAASDADNGRIVAASQTATNHPDCVKIKPFYWEIGDEAATLASGSILGAGTTRYDATSTMPIASASKWLYSSYWVQRTGGLLSATDIRFLNFHSGYTNFSTCIGSASVGDCLANGQNGVFDPATENKFAYGGGHMQKHAADNGLAALDSAQLTTEIRAQLGTDIGLAYGSPQPAGGANGSAAEYAKLLRKIVGGSLKMKDALGTHPVCTDPDTCANAVNAPTPPGEQWHYSVGHWVEDDPVVGDGAFSSPGAFGFYPWIDASKSFYGIVARSSGAGAISSVKCGRLIRKAWLTKTAP